MISSDDILLISASLITLAIIFLCFRYSKTFARINIILFVIYSAYFYFYLYFDKSAEAGLIWYAALLLTTGIQFFLVTTVVIGTIIKRTSSEA